MAKPRLARSERVRMKKSILKVANEIIATTDLELKQRLIQQECDKYDWYADVISYSDVERIIALDANIAKIKAECRENEYVVGMNRLDTLFKANLDLLRNYLLTGGYVRYGDVISYGTCAELLTKACDELGIISMTSSAYFTLLFDVLPRNTSSANGYLIIGEHNEMSYVTKGRLQSSLIKGTDV